MSDLFKKAISLGVGLTIVSKEKVEKVVEELVKRGELAPSESKALVDRLVERGEEERGVFKSAVHEQVERVLKELKIPVQSDVAELEARIAVLERRVAELEGSPSPEETLPETRTD
ncbi:polyhydroxyalkanoate synthesis regulator [Paenibacillus helianthi]|uniref:Polyhydroxyalkanoate synthesis regulator n=1 Tax=Paenibacillus helianthi TaxID=1349432 RepID=A0ABX3ELH6_9BACL|nr:MULTISPECIES: polyhydroxyalkanoate synthesis regulator [Paenibacillus]OKP78182.1 polyhydroxyalkanoate synthesis regulator [Paenibacillus sp. P3E]OKP85401.1 polyhydroxyalkanoate synthesis regulator [Paenibacillus helianthi]OKP85654.1 polyhydroxyalkanoate synthesis regulator [Paenibacillus sp. P32E]